MAKYKYNVLSTSGKEKRGMLEAATDEIAKNRLEADGYIVLSLEETIPLSERSWNIQIGNPVKLRDLCVFCRQFYSILDAGVTVIDALRMIAEQTESKPLAKALSNVQVSVEKGETLADAMKLEKKIFPDLLIHMVEAGEATGSLDISFERVANQFEKDQKLRSQIKQAMIYPIVILVVAVLVVGVLMVVVIPSFQDMFDQIGTDLPAITKGVINLSNFTQSNLIGIIIAIVLLIIGISVFRKSPTGKHVNSWIALNFPLFKKLSIKSASARLCNTLSTLIVAGVPLVDALSIVGNVMSNVIVREVLHNAREDVLQGISLSDPLERSKIFPSMVYHMIRIGEETGKTEKMLDKIADYYEEEVAVATKNLTTMLEPLIIVVLALIVGTVVLSVILPMTTLYNSLG